MSQSPTPAPDPVVGGSGLPTVLHVDLDAFFAAVEQRDKPSLRGRPVVVGGVGNRGVVSTASYEARAFGARSAMPTWQARRLCPPGTAFLSGRFEAYRASSRVVMGLLREVSPLVEQVSVDEAFVDLTGSPDSLPVDLEGRRALVADLLERIRVDTGGLTASAGLAGSKMMAKIASDLDKPAGLRVVPVGEESVVLDPLPVRALPGVGPVTAARLHTFGIERVEQLRGLTQDDLDGLFGSAVATGLFRLARARDDRAVVVEREAKSISAEETFPVDVTDPVRLRRELDHLLTGVVARLITSGHFARTVTVKMRRHDFSALTRSATLPHASGSEEDFRTVARRILATIDATDLDVGTGVRLLGVGVSGLSTRAQESLFPEVAARTEVLYDDVVTGAGDDAEDGPGGSGAVAGEAWRAGQDVRHSEYGAGWVWGSGRGVVTVRFEGPLTPPGRVRSFPADDPALTSAPPPDWRA